MVFLIYGVILEIIFYKIKIIILIIFIVEVYIPLVLKMGRHIVGEEEKADN
jgi:hypothetical protein